MVDIHTHILPGLDDGPDTIEEAVSMATIAAKNGFNHIVASSHGNCFPYSLEEYREQFRILKEELQRRQIPVTLYQGMEIYLDAYGLEYLDKGEFLSMNDTRYLLVEFPMDETPRNMCRRVAEIQKRKYNIILAHPERYPAIQNEPELLYYLKETGCLIQVNANSLIGQFGTVAKRLSRQMLAEGIADVIGTDAHDEVYRSPSIRSAMVYLRQRYPSQMIHLWLSENPSRILKGYPTLEVNRYKE